MQQQGIINQNLMNTHYSFIGIQKCSPKLMIFILLLFQLKEILQMWV